uniref:Uncharacterized protein n=1 Tax=Podoviridae sp. ctBev14 TaxID=2823556 RepID=A0A8S5LAV3_9CAUD|nr:MAG TPA: hypothetical protein [Podoviridae sp. ctBev14]
MRYLSKRMFPLVWHTKLFNIATLVCPFYSF